jgi:hypothetical protein
MKLNLLKSNNRMPKSKRNDHRRTITPTGAQIEVNNVGFAVIDGTETIAEIKWSEVNTIFSYTRFMGGEKHLCLAFVLPPNGRDQEDQVVVNENINGWASLAKALFSAFPHHDQNWKEKASVSSNLPSLPVANYTANPVKVWPFP